MSIFDRFKLTGKRLFITGGSRGLGREMAVAIADAGADVILVGRDQASLEKDGRRHSRPGPASWTIAADVGKPAECEQACQSALDRHGPIDILINNVGGRRENIPTEAMPLDKWRELIDLNLTSCMLCTKWLGAAMIERGRGGESSTSRRSMPWSPGVASRAGTTRRRRGRCVSFRVASLLLFHAEVSRRRPHRPAPDRSDTGATARGRLRSRIEPRRAPRHDLTAGPSSSPLRGDVPAPTRRPQVFTPGSPRARRPPPRPPGRGARRAVAR